MPDTSFTITDKGFKEAVAKLNSLQQLRAIRPTIKEVTLDLKGKVAWYPPTTKRKHNPGPYPARWYQRGWGNVWALKGGGKHKVSSPTSENLGASWGIKMRDGGMTGVIGTDTSYARVVQDEARQTVDNRRIGWRTVQGVAHEFGPAALRRIQMAIQRVLAGRGR